MSVELALNVLRAFSAETMYVKMRKSAVPRKIVDQVRYVMVGNVLRIRHAVVTEIVMALRSVSTVNVLTQIAAFRTESVPMVKIV